MGQGRWIWGNASDCVNLACPCIPRRAVAFQGFQAGDLSAQVKPELILIITDSLAPSFWPWNPLRYPLPITTKPRRSGISTQLSVGLAGAWACSVGYVVLWFLSLSPPFTAPCGRVGGDKLEALALGPRPQDRAPPARGRSKGRNTPRCAASRPGGAAPQG